MEQNLKDYISSNLTEAVSSGRSRLSSKDTIESITLHTPMEELCGILDGLAIDFYEPIDLPKPLSKSLLLKALKNGTVSWTYLDSSQLPSVWIAIPDDAPIVYDIDYSNGKTNISGVFAFGHASYDGLDMYPLKGNTTERLKVVKKSLERWI